MDYLYDGSFDGFLTSVYYSYYGHKADGIYPVNNYQFDLMTQSKIIQTDQILAAKVYDAAASKISSDFLQHAFYVFLSFHPFKENLILKYFQLGFKLGPKIDNYHTHPDVLPIQQLSKKVFFEAQRFYGFLRFVDTGKYLYAVLEPDHNILILLADHFSDRLAGEYFIIHDKKRGLAIIYNKKEWYLSDFSKEISIPNSETEMFYQELWTNYFTHIGIESRKNKTLQAHFVPQRYRHNLIEFGKFLN